MKGGNVAVSHCGRELRAAVDRDRWAAHESVIRQIVAESLCDVLDLGPAEKVLDVNGDGAFSLAAVRRGCDVASGTADALPFVDGVFDAVVSSFGVACAHGHQTTVREMLRVCRSSGRLGLAMRTPETSVRAFTVAAGCASLPPMHPLTSDRDLEDRLEDWFRDSAFDLHTIYRDVVFRHRAPEHSVDVLLNGDGPMSEVCARLPDETQRRLRHEMLELIDECHIANPPAVDVQSRYVEVLVVKH